MNDRRFFGLIEIELGMSDKRRVIRVSHEQVAGAVDTWITCPGRAPSVRE